MSGAMGAGGEEKPGTLCAPLPTSLSRGSSAQASLRDGSAWVCHWAHTPALPDNPLGILWGTGTNPWAVKSWFSSFLSQTSRWALKWSVFLNWECFTVVAASLLIRVLHRKKSQCLWWALVALLVVTPLLLLDSEKWAVWCRQSISFSIWAFFYPK